MSCKGGCCYTKFQETPLGNKQQSYSHQKSGAPSQARWRSNGEHVLKAVSDASVKTCQVQTYELSSTCIPGTQLVLLLTGIQVLMGAHGCSWGVPWVLAGVLGGSWLFVGGPGTPGVFLDAPGDPGCLSHSIRKLGSN